MPFLIFTLLALAAYLGLRSATNTSARDTTAALVISDLESLTSKVADVYYSLSPDTRANEEKYASVIARAEEQNGIPVGLLHRQLYQESHFRSDIISGQKVSGPGAVGIAQIIPRFHPDVDPLDPIASINYAARYMRSLYSRFGSWRHALAAYDWGEGNLSRALRTGESLPPETLAYVSEITSDVEVS